MRKRIWNQLMKNMHFYKSQLLFLKYLYYFANLNFFIRYMRNLHKKCTTFRLFNILNM